MNDANSSSLTESDNRLNRARVVFQFVLEIIEYIGFSLIVIIASWGIMKEICYQIYHNKLFSLTFIEEKTHSDLRNNYIGDLFFILILIEIVSLIKTTAKDHRLTPTYPIAIGITSLIRELIKPASPAQPYFIIVASFGIIALSGAIWILGQSPVVEGTEGD